MNPGEEFQPLMDAIFREKVLRARAIAPERKLLMGIGLFEQVEERMRAGVCQEHPDASPDAVERILRSRFARLRRVAEHGIYVTAN